MSKESKFYLALTLIGVCVSGAVFFYFNIDQSEMVATEGGSQVLQQLAKRLHNEMRILFMCLCLVPILPLVFFAKNNRP